MRFEIFTSDNVGCGVLGNNTAVTMYKTTCCYLRKPQLLWLHCEKDNKSKGQECFKMTLCLLRLYSVSGGWKKYEYGVLVEWYK